MIRVGVAGWTIPRFQAHRFTTQGTHLQRYAHAFSCVEINSSFYRRHESATYARWAASTPTRFQFAVKLPRTITHESGLSGARLALREFLEDTSGLGRKRGPLLVQLPPSLWFDGRVAARFFDAFRDRYDGPIVCEPRHPTWFRPAATQLLIRHQVARVAADPSCAPGGGAPGAWEAFAYFRLHGSPRMYWSRYDAASIEALARTLTTAARAGDVWCIFDNTALGTATENAFELRSLLKPAPFLPAAEPPTRAIDRAPTH
ncbi:MAG TPA: DUF72 domain-containing protein [Vicinamibacterales bacterium]|nr:DUF72 domain-containing protein [Vicinamibacterales bacterium]